MGQPSTELIETLWNVNAEVLKAEAALRKELIETLWNVNIDLLTGEDEETCELIETLWNVNINRKFINYITFFRINRNIVECKLNYLSAFLLILRLN